MKERLSGGLPPTIFPSSCVLIISSQYQARKTAMCLLHVICVSDPLKH